MSAVKKTLTVEDVIDPDMLACRISNKFVEWDGLRQNKIKDWQELSKYVFQTSTDDTAVGQTLPWSNKTTIPKLCQIRDNLVANYLASLFPKRKWLVWEGSSEEDETKAKRDAIESYMFWLVDRPEFYAEITKLIYDYVDTGNVIVMPEWYNGLQDIPGELREQVGFVGPVPRRIAATDIVFNPTASTFVDSPKIVRSLITLGDIKNMLDPDNTENEETVKLYNYLKEIRTNTSGYTGELTSKDVIYQVAGFGNYRDYLGSGVVELLTFYGDIYDEDNDVLLKNHVIQIADRHKVITKKPNPAYFGAPTLYHAGWRIRPDTLWAMGPLDNLVGMQYRIDHLENMKSDVFDLIAYPPLLIKGQVQDFNWGPMEKIYVDLDGAVTLLSPPVQALNADTQIAILESKMEELSGSPKEAMGFRTPGEKTAYEVQQLQNAAGRIFQSKVVQFERDLLEPLLNSLLELARRNMTPTTIRTFDNEMKLAEFMTLSKEDITGVGRIRPIAARHFAEQAVMVQNLTNFFGSAAGQDPDVRVHFSGLSLARAWEQLLDCEEYKIVNPYIRIAEQADAQRRANSAQQMVAMEAQTAGGILPGDHDAAMETMPLNDELPVQPDPNNPVQ